MLTFASFPAGLTGSLPAKLVTREETLAFARAFDPQPMHLDDAAGAKSILGGISASGWHTCAILMRIICDGFLTNTASMGSPGIAEVRWLKPVKPGDTLAATYEVKEARLSAKRPEMGVCRFAYDMRNQDGVSVMTWDCTQLLLAASDSRSGSRPEAYTSAARAIESPKSAADKHSHNLYLEDYQPGDITALGTHTFTTDAIKDFARRYDPQPFHLDEAAAERSSFGGLSASGWHTAALWMKLMVAHQTAAIAAVMARGQKPGRLGPSPGFRDMRWREPVRPGDTITYSSRVTGAEDWPGRPAWGLLRMTNEGRNQHGRVVFSFDGRVLVERRTALPG